ncbi:MAG: phosphoglycerate kinase [Prosthecochloris sp.]|uniref:Phosphoglycerate kinase n=1 Tax=Prosthecochloris aestuarii (strain DSM 271 / SK 413) TaxID=290512 RepID=PGK_PROA2|nr:MULTISPECIES: phosphoglycerate kinase [Prosthecochloris]B4S6S2.1 RecName: Full=Phosphoglycerate kinase [Prosthecochloris aestuarii DSM 271]ACF47277.1 Phosphoglycerate kinase [Prosthecochloris aestuarii DSM 271]MCW8797684.1 phosphoglycerate kinase [Prosthecochloris sp.]
MQKKTLSDISCKGKRILMRVDFNVPLDLNGTITNDKRIIEALPSIRQVLETGGRLILMSHLGRPKGKVTPELSLAPVARRLSELLDTDVVMANNCIGTEAMQQALALQDGEVMMLENLRFHPEEEKNDPEFARELASMGEIYVNDAFGTAHRAHASTEGICHYVPISVAGFLIEKELRYLGNALANPERPFLAILGGAKISGKIDVLDNLFDKVDTILIGGAMIFTFFKAQGYQVGTSLVEEDKIELAKHLLEKAAAKNIRMLLPEDVIAASAFSADAETATVPIDSIPETMMGLDIGPKTIDTYSREILKARTIVWNGPMGVFEIDAFATGTIAIAHALADATAKGAISIIGGGDSAAAVMKAGLESGITHISTGGGASLEFLEGKELPGIAALND